MLLGSIPSEPRLGIWGTLHVSCKRGFRQGKTKNRRVFLGASNYPKNKHRTLKNADIIMSQNYQKIYFLFRYNIRLLSCF